MGTELNAEITERVMGCPRPAPITWPLEYDHLPIRRNGWTWIDTKGEWAPIHNYSTDISAAMQVLAKSDGMWELARWKEGGPWMFRCYLRFGEDGIGTATANTAEMAICLAALKAQDAATASALAPTLR